MAEHPIRDVAERIERELAQVSTRREKTFIGARILFFDFNIYPSAHTVLAYTQQGSVTDINRDLRDFWADLRDKGRAKLTLPIFPPELAEQLSQSLSSIWELAMAKAAESLAEDKMALEEQRQAIAVESEKARLLVEHMKGDLELARQRAALAESGAEEATTLLRLAEQKSQSLATELSELRDALKDAQSAQEASVTRFEEKIAQMGAEHARYQEVMEGQIKFVTLQIDHARATERELRAAVEKAKTDGATALSEYRVARYSAETKLQAALIKNAELSGRLKALIGQERDASGRPGRLVPRKTRLKGRRSHR